MSCEAPSSLISSGSEPGAVRGRTRRGVPSWPSRPPPLRLPPAESRRVHPWPSVGVLGRWMRSSHLAKRLFVGYSPRQLPYPHRTSYPRGRRVIRSRRVRTGVVERFARLPVPQNRSLPLSSNPNSLQHLLLVPHPFKLDHDDGDALVDTLGVRQRVVLVPSGLRIDCVVWGTRSLV
jgi:hypothetical protein